MIHGILTDCDDDTRETGILKNGKNFVGVSVTGVHQFRFLEISANGIRAELLCSVSWILTSPA